MTPSPVQRDEYGIVIDHNSAERVQTWSMPPPSDCPIERSNDFWGLEFTGRYVTYTNADTWYPSWAADDRLYAPFTDGTVGRFACCSKGEMAMSGLAVIEGADPFHLKIEPIATTPEAPHPYGGRYPSALLAHDDVLYYGTYCLDEDPARGLNWETMGPFVGFRISADRGETWELCPHRPDAPIFGESGKDGAKVRMGAPHFVDLGRELEYSSDGYAYLVAHGGQRPDANVSWISGDEVNLARVKPSRATINIASEWEFFAGTTSDGSPSWSSSLDDMVPLVTWNDHMGCTTVTYNPFIGRYLMAVTDGWPTIGAMTSYLLESEYLTGPWRMAAHLPDFGEQAYFLTIPSKFQQPDGTMWLAYSANFTNHVEALDTPVQPPNPPGSRYALTMQEFRLVQTEPAT